MGSMIFLGVIFYFVLGLFFAWCARGRLRVDRPTVFPAIAILLETAAATPVLRSVLREIGDDFFFMINFGLMKVGFYKLGS